MFWNERPDITVRFCTFYLHLLSARALSLSLCRFVFIQKRKCSAFDSVYVMRSQTTTYNSYIALNSNYPLCIPNNAPFLIFQQTFTFRSNLCPFDNWTWTNTKYYFNGYFVRSIRKQFNTIMQCKHNHFGSFPAMYSWWYCCSLFLPAASLFRL